MKPYNSTSSSPVPAPSCCGCPNTATAKAQGAQATYQIVSNESAADIRDVAVTFHRELFSDGAYIYLKMWFKIIEKIASFASPTSFFREDDYRHCHHHPCHHRHRRRNRPELTINFHRAIEFPSNGRIKLVSSAVYVFHALSRVGICELTEAISRKRLDGNLCDPLTTPLQSPLSRPRNPRPLRRDRLFSSPQRRPKNNITTIVVSAFISRCQRFSGKTDFSLLLLHPEHRRRGGGVGG
ncbi:hypothetical protein QTP88_015025 [Uroleucon formosanum]